MKKCRPYLVVSFWRRLILTSMGSAISILLFFQRAIGGELVTAQTAEEPSSTTPGTTAKTYLTLNDIKCKYPASPDCRKEMLCKISILNEKKPYSRKDCEDRWETYAQMNGNADCFTSYRFQKDRVDTTIVSIHGLWGNSMQFAPILEKMGDEPGLSSSVNTIELTLPGHPRRSPTCEFDNEAATFASHEEWEKALEETLKLANAFSDNVVVVGQSNGALLGVLAAKEFPDLVDQLILIEPALQVRGLNAFGSCVAVHLLPRKIVAWIAKKRGVPLTDDIDIRMGCEVNELGKKVFPVVPNKDGTAGLPNRNTYSDIARQVNTPVLLINNEKDKVVSGRVNREFFKGLSGKKRYFGINKDGKMPHGRITSGQENTKFIADAMYEFLSSDVKLPAFVRSLRYKVFAEAERFIARCYNGETWSDCRSRLLKERKQRLGTRTKFCNMLGDDTKCRAANRDFDAMEAFEEELSLYADQYGIEKTNERAEFLRLNPDSRTPAAQKFWKAYDRFYEMKAKMLSEEK